MKHFKSLFLFIILFLSLPVLAQKKGVYRKGWIDFNKDGRMDVYENPAADIEHRIENLLSKMTLNEKTNQIATQYGYGRVLKDKLPTPGWKNERWKDGIANIDEQLRGVKG